MRNLTKRASFHQKKSTELRNLMNKPDIVTKEADKGDKGGPVIDS